ncbi:MAG: helix-hairpin-helix domain-containing protein [Candidatus Nanoarchaeia archaeon]|nr:helix-hairpin-helix domain-containing protein [Candidatus Nanoarchaeia archaeon]
MNTLEKAKILGNASNYDSCGPKMCEVNVKQGLGGIYYAKAEHKTCRIFKTLMENSCSFDCKYCENSTHCKKRKASYEPEELASLFNYLRKNLAVEGLFLSSAVSKDSDKVTEKMIETVKILRFKYKFNGYVHFKILPGTSYELVKQASEISNRLSVNIESPNKNALSELSSCKDYKNDILKRQAWISRMNLSSGQTTQMILNKISTDKDVLKMSNWEYKKLGLRRVYFSAFSPVKGTPLENEKPEKKKRESYLYNVDFLMRDYNYKIKEFYEIMDDGMLPNKDPKMAIAIQNFEKPVDINEASYEELIRIPGIGPKTAKRILKEKKITKYEQLNKLGAWISRAKPFIKVDGHTQKMLV